MFWAAGEGTRTLTAGQGEVVKRYLTIMEH